MKFSVTTLQYILSTAIVLGGHEQHGLIVSAAADQAGPLPLSSYTKNPNSDYIPMIPAPKELVGSWKGSNCGMDDPSPVVAELELADNGANIWSFANPNTGQLESQTGDGIEVIVGYQCIDVGKGYWWGQVPYSDVLWCNLFQVQEMDDTPKGEMKQVSYINLAYGGQGVGAPAMDACPTSLTKLDKVQKPLQASFVRAIEASSLEFTCNVPAGSDRVQPSHNSQFPPGQPIPNPFEDAATAKSLFNRRIVLNPSAEGGDNDFLPTLPVLNEATCRVVGPSVVATNSDMGDDPEKEQNEDETLLFSSAASKNAGIWIGIALVNPILIASVVVALFV